MKIIGLITLIFSAQNIFATTKLVSYPTNYETVTVSGTTVTLYAGLTDNAIRSSCGSTGPCDTCALDTSAIVTTSVCGKKEVLTSDTVSITLNITGNSTLTSAAEGKICLDTNCSSGISSPSYTAYASGSNLTISTTWSSICGATTAGSSCAGSFDETFYFGYKESSSSSLTEYVTLVVKFRYVSSADARYAYQSFGCAAPVTGEGFCYFDVYPGDKKAYIIPEFNSANSTGVVADYSGYSTGLDPSGMKYKYLRVLYLQGTGPTDTQGAHAADFTQAIAHEDLSYNPSTGEVSPKKISNLTNQDPVSGNAYLLLTASVDQAGLVTNYSDPTVLCTGSYGTANLYATTETQCVLPQRVSGLLDGQECFIATATYGSSMAPEVESFRRFRGEYLLKSEVGKFFVRTYYKYSPPLAEIISHSEELKLLSQIFLFPILMFVKLSLLIGMLPAMLVVLSLFSGFGFWFLRQRAGSRIKA